MSAASEEKKIILTPLCVCCRAVAQTSTAEAAFFLGYAAGAEDAGLLGDVGEHIMCPEHQVIREAMLDALEESS